MANPDTSKRLHGHVVTGIGAAALGARTSSTVAALLLVSGSVSKPFNANVTGKTGGAHGV